MAHRWGADFITHQGIISAAPYEAILLGKHEHRTQGIIMFPANDGGVERALFQHQKLIVMLDAVPNIIGRLLMPPLEVVLTNSGCACALIDLGYDCQITSVERNPVCRKAATALCGDIFSLPFARHYKAGTRHPV